MRSLPLLLFAGATCLASTACEPARPSASSTAPSPTVAPQPTNVATTASAAPASAPADGGVLLQNAEPTVRLQIHPGAKRCYQHGLEVDPTQAGRIVVFVQMDSSGVVTDASIASNAGISAQVAECIAGVARSARFPPPGPDGVKISIPFNFVRLAPRAEDAGR
jgi:hypothetical protein